MKISNRTKDTVLAEEAILAGSLFKRIKGLLGKKELKHGQALILKPCNSIHTFFMSFPIDVLFMGKQNEVVKAISNIHPFRLSGVYFRASYVIELPAGTLQITRTEDGDHLQLE